MHRDSILNLLDSYQPCPGIEEQMSAEMKTFINTHADCFERTQLAGHVTGSAWIVNPERTHVLLIHHIKLDKWFQPGGHCDGDPDVLAVATREAGEETGLICTPVNPGIFDIDNHTIPERGEIPAHIHYDIRFLLQTPKQADILSGNKEVSSIRWVPLKEIRLYNDSDSIKRMVQKTMYLAANLQQL